MGFAAETQDIDTYARQKLVSKNLDMIVANDVSRSDIGFNSDENAVTVFWSENQQSFDPRSKSSLAMDLIELIAHQFAAKQADKVVTQTQEKE